jgi:molybdate transport system substrate-binding protein
MITARNLGYVRSTGTLLAQDTLRVVLPPTNPGNIHTLQDLARPGLRYLGVAPEDGLNRHIQSTLESMILDPAFGKGYSARVYGNLYDNYTNGLRAAQALLANPPAGDFAIIYQNDFLAIQRQYGARALLSLPFPAPFDQSFPMVASVTTYTPHPDLAQQYIQFLRSPQAQKIWAQYGFQPAS